MIQNVRLFFDRMKIFIALHSLQESDKYICGDFNCSFERKNDKSHKKLAEIINYLDLVDIWKHKTSNTEGYTWCDSENNPKSRIDFIFTSKLASELVEKIQVKRIQCTHSKGNRMCDHRFLKIIVKIDKLKRGPGYWKLNTSHFENDEYREGIKNIFKGLHNSLDVFSRWETFKLRVRDFSINCAKKSSNNIKSKIQNLEMKIDEVETLPSEMINMKEKRDLESELDKLQNEIAKGAQIRSKERWINEGEKNTSYFLGLEKKNQTNNTIKELRDVNNKIINTNSEIIKEICNFYENLYTTKSIDGNKISNYINDIKYPTLNEQDKLICDALPTLDECKEAVFNMKNNKSPGLDGLPCEFYKCFWEYISPIFFYLLKRCVF